MVGSNPTRSAKGPKLNGYPYMINPVYDSLSFYIIALAQRLERLTRLRIFIRFTSRLLNGYLLEIEVGGSNPSRYAKNIWSGASMGGTPNIQTLLCI